MGCGLQLRFLLYFSLVPHGPLLQGAFCPGQLAKPPVQPTSSAAAGGACLEGRCPGLQASNLLEKVEYARVRAKHRVARG